MDSRAGRGRHLMQCVTSGPHESWPAHAAWHCCPSLAGSPLHPLPPLHLPPAPPLHLPAPPHPLNPTHSTQPTQPTHPSTNPPINPPTHSTPPPPSNPAATLPPTASPQRSSAPHALQAARHPIAARRARHRMAAIAPTPTHHRPSTFPPRHRCECVARRWPLAMRFPGPDWTAAAVARAWPPRLEMTWASACLWQSQMWRTHVRSQPRAMCQTPRCATVQASRR